VLDAGGHSGPGTGRHPIDYKNADFVKEIHRLTGDGVNAVFDGIGGDNSWRSRDALREGGRVVTAWDDRTKLAQAASISPSPPCRVRYRQHLERPEQSSAQLPVQRDGPEDHRAL
jgi:NADPH:quinone reductase-like Zn-dependent oxidoreductase